MVSKTKLIALGIVVLLATITVAAALNTWTGTASWSMKKFSVWDSSTSGTQLASPYTLPNPPTTPGTYTYNYYIQNDGTSAATVTVTNGQITGTGNTAQWNANGVYSLPVSTARVNAILTLTITTDGTYTWTFTIS
jgi:archaellum component FlaG (FlaF/FlaG flagellin family)